MLLILLSYFVFHLDGHLATIVSAGGAYSVIDVVSATVGAYCQCGGYCLVMGAALGRTCLRLSSFRMCHNSFVFLLKMGYCGFLTATASSLLILLFLL
jgi:uncharacterized membrane protein